MKWMILLFSGLLLSGCYTTTTRVIEYRQVTVAPAVESTIWYNDDTPLDVTETTVQYY